jgi:hypothetical protein
MIHYYHMPTILHWPHLCYLEGNNSGFVLFSSVIACTFNFCAEITGFCPKLAIFLSILLKTNYYDMIH